MALSDLIPGANPDLDPFAPKPRPAQLGGLHGLPTDPADINMTMPQAAPPAMPGLRPLVTSPRQQQEQALQAKISAFENPAAPKPGFWHQLGRISQRAAEIAGSTLFPEVVASIPGTQLNKQGQHAQNVSELAGLQSQDRADQQQASEDTLRSAQTRETEARADALENPPEKQRTETPQQGYADAISDALTRGVDPATDPHVMAWKAAIDNLAKPQKDPNAKEQVESDLLDAEKKGDKPRIAKDQQTLKDMNPQAEQRFSFDVGNAGNKQDVALKQATAKAFQPSSDSAERFNVMAKNYEDAIRDHNQQAMLSLLANHLGMTMGLQKGARLTKDIIRETQQSRPWLQGIEAKFDSDGVLSGVTLTPQQMRQMVDLGRERYMEDTTKARNESRYLGATDDGPARTPSRSTINYYMGLANGDVNKAKQMATEDGWTVK